MVFDWLRQHGVTVIEAGDGTPAGQALERSLAKSDRYGGHGPVPAARVSQLIEEVIDPGSLGFERVNGRTWGRLGDPSIKLLTTGRTKGYGLELRWAVSLPFVPHRILPSPQFHRTLKSARMDLFETSQNVTPSQGTGEDYGTIDTGLGETCLKDDAARVWATVRSIAVAFWAGTDSIQEIYETALRHRELEQARLRMHHLPEPAVVAALVAARLGLTTEYTDLLSVARVKSEERAVLIRLAGQAARDAH